MPAVIIEGVFDRLDAGIAELVGACREAQALIVVVRGAAVFWPKGREEIDAESHRLILCVARSRGARRASGRRGVSPHRRPCGQAPRNAARAPPARVPRGASCWRWSAPARTRY